MYLLTGPKGPQILSILYASFCIAVSDALVLVNFETIMMKAELFLETVSGNDKLP